MSPVRHPIMLVLLGVILLAHPLAAAAQTESRAQKAARKVEQAEEAARAEEQREDAARRARRAAEDAPAEDWELEDPDDLDDDLDGYDDYDDLGDSYELDEQSGTPPTDDETASDPLDASPADALAEDHPLVADDDRDDAAAAIADEAAFEREVYEEAAPVDDAPSGPSVSLEVFRAAERSLEGSGELAEDYDDEFSGLLDIPGYREDRGGGAADDY